MSAFEAIEPNADGLVIVNSKIGPDADDNVWAEVDVLRVPKLTAQRVWRMQGGAAATLTVSRMAPSPHPLRLERADGSLIVELPPHDQAFAQLHSRHGRWELGVGGAVPVGGGATRPLKGEG